MNVVMDIVAEQTQSRPGFEIVTYLTMRLALGTSFRSFRLSPKNSLSKTFFGKVCVKLSTSWPISSATAEATSNKVVVTGKVFMTLPLGVCNRNLVSVYSEAGLEVVGPLAVVCGAAGHHVSSCKARKIVLLDLYLLAEEAAPAHPAVPFLFQL